MSIRTLVVGFGYAAQTFHVPFLEAIDAFFIDGVVSSDSAKVERVLPGVRVYDNLETALQQAQFDLVIVTTPNHLHAPQTELALSAGCHVLVEKPFTLSASEAQTLVTLAKQQQRHLCVFHNRRFDGDFLTIKQLLAELAVGEVKRFENRFDRFRPQPRNRWRENAGPGSGIFWDLGPHLIDQCLQLFGLPDTVSASINTLRAGGESDDAFDVNLHYPTLQAVVGSSPFEAAPTLRFSLQGTAGSYRKYHLDPQEAQLKNHRKPGDADWAITPTEQHGVLYKADSHQIYPTLTGDYTGFYTQLGKALEPGATTPVPVPADTIVNVIAVIELAKKAALTGTRLPVDTAKLNSQAGAGASD
ncbi:Gfo/Idh/MocA family protein [Alteromonas gilva]|uniref:Gfo/Idh/MocA family oxidoreductase n=1 Tax=Alteromonas gilva TaxID=2987522 RepID=A0ABT5KXJ6_9ALTE|nr:Gfo/Idh/MocA family oxidoreductase [Alteromonas gilva]MDC8829495.1 Gfo/Idh/MocA family oxidoreductase [Alteromonas gilva]